jgi:hypothetical protein
VSTIGKYQAALRDYQAKRDVAADMFRLMTTVADSIAYRQVAFLAHFFGVSPPADEVLNVRNEARNHRYDLTKWPSYEEMKTTVQNWHSSFAALNEAWQQIPQEERTALVAPPKVMRTT